MATINIIDLQMGVELFADSESYLNELVDNEPTIIKGGLMVGEQPQNSTYFCSNCIPTIINSPFCTQNLTNVN